MLRPVSQVSFKSIKTKMVIEIESCQTDMTEEDERRMGSQLHIEALIRIALMELPLSQAEEMVTPGYIEAALGGHQIEGRTIYTA
jgi:hypothetical protein